MITESEQRFIDECNELRRLQAEKKQRDETTRVFINHGDVLYMFDYPAHASDISKCIKATKELEEKLRNSIVKSNKKL